MDKIMLRERAVPVKYECDVLVVGLGVGGVCAAVAASRQAVSVIALEQASYPGGVATAGGMCSISNYFVTSDGSIAEAGIPLEYMNRMVQSRGMCPDFARAAQPQVPFDPECAKRVMLEMLNDAKVTAIFGVFAYGVLMEGKTVTHVLCHGTDGYFAVKAKRIVDATGDISIFKLAGAKYEEYDDSGSFLFRMQNVDIDRIVDWFEAHPESYDPQCDIPTSLADTLRNWREYGVFHLPHGSGKSMETVQKAISSGRYSSEYLRHAVKLFAMGMFASKANPGIVLINSMFFKGNCYDINWMSECEEDGRLTAKYIADFLIEFFPGFENSFIADCASRIGWRSNRTLISRHMLTVHELADGVLFDDVVGQTTEVDRRIPGGRCRYSQPAQIPLASLLSDDTANVLLGSGKNIGNLNGGRGMLRGQAGCMAIGQGAGAAAGVSVLMNFTFDEPDVSAIQNELSKMKVKFKGV